MSDAADDADDSELDIDSEPFRCWCGAEGTCDEMCDETGLDDACGGTGVLYCYCGGDQCVCHHHGETECPGCEDCEPGRDDDDEPDWFYGGEG